MEMYRSTGRTTIMKYGKKSTTMKKSKSTKKGLTDRQKQTLKRHSVHHTAKHMSMMRRLMRNGMSFTQAHKMAMSKVGK